jgi:dolichyl-phosphate beta-glucosyltransferase
MSADAVPVIVVPCYNEERRLDEQVFVQVAQTGQVRLLFVDDGSTDGTARILHRMAARSEAIEVLGLAENAGKAEAVRRGLLVAVRAGAAIVGYYDADLATPPAELARLIQTLQAGPELAGVFGCRVARLGSSIRRSAWRHYLGRAYATLASMALGVSVYDTQCGAKVFRVNETFVDALTQPFPSEWTLDVELLHRLLRGRAAVAGLPATAFAELPLETWRDVGGSKLRLGAAMRALVDLARIARSRRGHQRAGHGSPRPVVETPVITPQVGPNGQDPRRARRSGHSDRTRHQA